MKTTKQEATARPLNHNEIADSLLDIAFNHLSERQDFEILARDVRRLGAEHAALLAVAENQDRIAALAWWSENYTPSPDEFERRLNDILSIVRGDMATLAVVRGQKGE